MRPNRVRVEDNAKAVKLASDARSTYVVKQDIVDGGKSLSQRADNRLLGQQRRVLDGSAPRGSGFGTGHKIIIQRSFCIRRWQSIYRSNYISPSESDYRLACLSHLEQVCQCLLNT